MINVGQCPQNFNKRVTWKKTLTEEIQGINHHWPKITQRQNRSWWSTTPFGKYFAKRNKAFRNFPIQMDLVENIFQKKKNHWKKEKLEKKSCLCSKLIIMGLHCFLKAWLSWCNCWSCGICPPAENLEAESVCELNSYSQGFWSKMILSTPASPYWMF